MTMNFLFKIQNMFFLFGNDDDDINKFHIFYANNNVNIHIKYIKHHYKVQTRALFSS